MPQPYYRLAIDICILGLKESDDIWMRCVKGVQFTPVEGMALQWQNDDEEYYRVELVNVVYDFSESMFIEEQSTDEVATCVREGNTYSDSVKAVIEQYQSFGFQRIRFPVAQVVHGE